MMRATTRPRRSSGARSAAKGIMTWPATDAPPTATDASAEEPQVGGQGAGHQGDRRHERRCGLTSVRRGCRSPRGTTSSSPAA